MPVQSGQTYSPIIVFTEFTLGSPGLVGILPDSPDLVATYTYYPPPNTLDLIAVIRPIQSGTYNLNGYIRSANSGYLDLDASITGVFEKSLLAAIRASNSGYLDLTGSIEPIPPLSLSGSIQSVFENDLPATILAVEPKDLPAIISGASFKDLSAIYNSFHFSDLGSVYSGFYSYDLPVTITGLGVASGDLNSQIRGFLGIEVPESISGYIFSNTGNVSSISASLLGVLKSDLFANIKGFTYEDLPANISGVLFDGALQALITSTGSLLDLQAYLIATQFSNKVLQANIDGTGILDLQAQLNAFTSYPLFANISATGINYNDIFATLSGVETSTLSATYDPVIGNLLEAQIETIEGSKLFAVIEPKVFYIESSIPINTYPISDIKVVINSDVCLPRSFYSNLSVIISGSIVGDLSANVVGVAGQLALSTDEILVNIKQKVISEDWAFFIFDQLAYAENYVQLVITNSPYADLGAAILGVQASGDLMASLDPVYYTPVVKTGVPLGQWVNFKTGETKLIRLFFKGNANNFYYSPDSSYTYSENPTDSLEIFVESYKKTTDTNSLLNLKTDVNACRVNLDGFSNIDDAIKYAIACSLSEIHSDLSATITAIGNTDDITGTIITNADTIFGNLPSKINSVGNDPDLFASVSGTGSIMDLTSMIYPLQPQITATPFFDTEGQRYMPTLVINGNGDYSVVLTPISASGIVEIFSPDLYASISGTGVEDLPATVSGL